jgi:hypothetical protein
MTRRMTLCPQGRAAMGAMDSMRQREENGRVASLLCCCIHDVRQPHPART